jgi:hypothetical protein
MRMACTLIASRWHNDEVGTISAAWDDNMDAARDSVIDVFETALPMVRDLLACCVLALF